MFLTYRRLLWAEGQVELFFNPSEDLGQPHSELSLTSTRNLNLRISTLVTCCRLALEGGTSLSKTVLFSWENSQRKVVPVFQQLGEWSLYSWRGTPPQHITVSSTAHCRSVLWKWKRGHLALDIWGLYVTVTFQIALTQVESIKPLKRNTYKELWVCGCYFSFTHLEFLLKIYHMLDTMWGNEIK